MCRAPFGNIRRTGVTDGLGGRPHPQTVCVCVLWIYIYIYMDGKMARGIMIRE
jgi:hypothetical protein